MPTNDKGAIEREVLAQAGVTAEPAGPAEAKELSPLHWLPIEQAPTDGTELLLTRWTPENGYGHVDFGAFGFIENSDYDDSPIYGWLSNYGNIDEPTHFINLAAPVHSEPLTIALGQGLIEIGQGHQGDERLPAILFGRNGAGAVGVETEGNRVMEPGECIAAITFENYQSLDVVVEKLGELRMRIWPDAPHSQLSYGAAPHYRGYAHLGIGAYVLNHSAAGEPPELAISIATEAQKAGRVVGDMRDNEPGELVQPKDIAVRLRFENVAGLDALEQQLRFVRSEHFAQQSTADKASEVRAAEKDAAPVISSYDIEKVKKLKYQFVDSLIHSGIQYRTCGAISAVLNRIINDSEAAAMAAAPSTADSANTGALGEKGAEA